jgi:hypothetical protein
LLARGGDAAASGKGSLTTPPLVSILLNTQAIRIVDRELWYPSASPPLRVKLE